MKRIVEIAPMSAAQFGGFLYGLVGVFATFLALFGEEKSLYAPLGLLLPYLSVKLDFTLRSVQLALGPVLYAASGAISFSFAALTYNIFAGFMGGLKVSVRE